MSVTIDNIPLNSITPEQQFIRLIPSKEAFKSTMLRLKASRLDINLIPMIMDYFVDMKPHLTNWYKPLKELGIVPKYVPALPCNIHEILYTDCPIMGMGRKLKQDGESYKLFETHSLYLIPPNSLNDLEARVSAYGWDVLGAQNNSENPLRFNYFYRREEFGNIASDRWEWVLIPNTVIEETRDKSYSNQLEILKGLNRISGADYEVATMRQMAIFLFFHKIATNESLYEFRNAQNGNRSTFARVQEQNNSSEQFLIGGSSPSGVFVNGNDCNNNYIGLAVLRKFS